MLRPVVSGINGPTEGISEFLDKLLKPTLKHIPSLLKDSTQLIQILENNKYPSEALLVTLDVKSLYEVIPIREGIECVVRFYRQHTEICPIPLEYIRTLLNIVLSHNIFELNGKMYRQIREVAMGIRVAPTFANINMAQVEHQFLQSLAESFPSPLLYKRYIDDITIIWPASETLFLHFLEKLNNMHPTIKFTSKYSSQTIHYLDLEIYKASRFSRTNIFDLQPYKGPHQWPGIHRITYNKSANLAKYLVHSRIPESPRPRRLSISNLDLTQE